MYGFVVMENETQCNYSTTTDDDNLNDAGDCDPQTGLLEMGSQIQDDFMGF